MSKKETVWSTAWTTYGKWILAGEHAVLRGAPALVFPLRDRKMEFQYEKNHNEFMVEFSGVCGEELKLIFWGLLEEALKQLGLRREQVTGRLSINSDLPLGAGLGASAALCVGVSRLFKNLGFLQEEGLFEFSRKLENLFHGESSGVDIAIALTGEPLKFFRKEGRMPLSVRWRPQFYISYSGKRGVTSECVNKVMQMHKANTTQAEELDRQMAAASELCEKSLSLPTPEGLKMLVQGMDKAAHVFQDWGLTEGELDQHMRLLRNAGALAVKPTGSGGGGYVLSLWTQTPPTHLNELLRAF